MHAEVEVLGSECVDWGVQPEDVLWLRAAEREEVVVLVELVAVLVVYAGVNVQRQVRSLPRLALGHHLLV